MLRRQQPQILINNRADMPEDFHSREGDAAVGDFDNQHLWELCTTIAGAWGYEPTSCPSRSSTTFICSSMGLELLELPNLENHRRLAMWRIVFDALPGYCLQRYQNPLRLFLRDRHQKQFRSKPIER